MSGTAGQLGLSAIGAVMWSAAQRWAVRITGFVTIAILTRLLSPADFGNVAVASAILPLAYLLADMGFSTYIVQAADPDRRAMSTAFWFSAAAGVLLAGLLVAGAPLLALLFSAPDSIPVVWGFAPVVILVTLSTVPVALLKRGLRFRALAIQATVASLLGQLVAVVIALAGLGVWALVGQMLAYQLSVAILAWASARWRPGLGFSADALRAMASFGVKVVGVDLVGVLSSWAQNAIVSAALGVSGLGYLNVAQRLTQVAQDLTGAAVMPVSTVVFSRVRGSERFRSGYLQALGIGYAVTVPVMVFLAASAPRLVPLLFGEKWHSSIGPSQLLALAGILTLGAALDHGLFYGAGRPGRWFLYAVAIDAMTVAATAVSAAWGLVALAAGFCVVAVVATATRVPLAGRLVGAPWYVIAAMIGRALLAGVAGGGVGLVVAVSTTDLPSVIAIALIGLSVVVAYAAAALVLLRPELRLGMRLLRARQARQAADPADVDDDARRPARAGSP